jgi:outer membrane usher protein
MDAGYSQGQNFETLNLGAAGSIVAHAGGINLGQPLGENFTLVEVPGSPTTRITNYTGVTTGANGYAVLPSVQPYRANWVTVDTRNLGAGTEIDNPTQQIIPRRGSVTVARFNAKNGRRVQFELIQPDGSLIPFGASVETIEGQRLAISDPTGRALVLVEAPEGTLKVKSGGRICHAPYALSKTERVAGYEHIKVVCQ